MVGDLTSASTSYRTSRGVTSASWKLNGNTLLYDVVVPVGSKGTIYLDGISITESGSRLRPDRSGILSVENNDGQAIISAGLGCYSFSLSKD